MSLRNWKHFKMPFSKMKNFTQHEPFPGQETKATYIDGRKSHPAKGDKKYSAKDAARALRRRGRR